MSDKGVDEGSSGNGSGVPEAIVGHGDVPTVFANGFAMMAGAYGVQFIFLLKNAQTASQVPVANVHLSPELAKVVGRIIRKNVLAFEAQMGGPVNLPTQLLQDLGLVGLEE